MQNLAYTNPQDIKEDCNSVQSTETDEDFILLVKNGRDAELCLNSYKDCHLNLLDDVLEPVARHGTLNMLKTVMNTFKHQVVYTRASSMWRVMCEDTRTTDGETMYAKAALVLDMWKGQLTAEVITDYLRTQLGHSGWSGNRDGRGVWHGQIGQLIVKTYMDLVQDEGIEFALTLCLFPLNLELFDAVLSAKLEQGSKNSRLLHWVHTKCAELGDTDTLAHILAKYKALVGSAAINVWCKAGNIKGLTMLFESGIHTSQLIEHSEILVGPCRNGNEELTEFLIRSIGSSLEDSYYCEALESACFYEHEGVIRILAACRDRVNFKPEAAFDLDLRCIKPSIIRLLNSIFGTTIDPSKGRR